MAKPETDRLPPQVKYIVGNEACERFSFYGMGSILTIYMARVLHFGDTDAEYKYHLFNMACYLMPLLGGWLSDRYIGRYRTILWLSFGYVAGHAVIALWEGAAGLYAGMALIALGAGGIKPCVSAFVGDQFTSNQQHLIDRVYSLFYLSINVGSLFGTTLIPLLLDHSGPRMAFGVPGIAMAIALVFYVMGRRDYRRAPPAGKDPNSFTAIVGYALTHSSSGGGSFLDRAKDNFPAEAVEGVKAVFRIALVFSTVIAFWAYYYQYGSSWTLQADTMDLNVLGFKLAASQIQTLNAALILIMVPLFSYWVYPFLERRGWRITALRKMAVGMFITCLSCIAAAVVQIAIDRGGHPNVAWQFWQYLFIAAAETLISVTALEFAYTQAPPTMKSTIMSLWFLSISGGNFVAAMIAKFAPVQGASFYYFYMVFTFIAAIVFALIAARYRPSKFQAAGAEPVAHAA